jgi:hypothetical protein
MIKTISPQYYFHAANGIIVKSLNELPAVLERLDNSIFSMHVSPSKNDFAAWVKDVFKLPALSSVLQDTQSKEKAIRILKAYFMQSQMTNIPRMSAQEAQPDVQNARYSNDKESKEEKTQQTDHKKFLWTSQRLTPKSEKTPKQKVLVKKEKKEIKKELMTNDPDEYFERHPVIMEHAVASRKKAFSTQPLEIISYRGDETPDKLIELFKESYAKAYTRLSTLRKTGFDTSLAELMLYRIPVKIKVFEASRESKDATIIKRYLNEIIEELNNIK